MATEVIYNGDGSDVTFDITFPFLRESDVKVSVGGDTKNSPADYSITGTVVTFVTAPPNATGNVRIYRNTDIDEPRSTFETGSSIRANELNRNIKQLLFAIKEVGTVTANDSGLGLVAGSKGDIHVNTATDWYIRNDSVENNMMADNSVGTSELIDLNIVEGKLANDSVSADKLRDSTSTDSDRAVTTNHIRDNAIVESKVAGDAITHVQLKDSTSTDSDRAVTTNHIRDNAITTAKILDGNVTKAKIESGILIPVGGIIWWPKVNIPTGYLLCAGQTIPDGTGTVDVLSSDWNIQGGQSVTQVTADFSALYAIVGATLPDLRGEFIRGWDAYRAIDTSNGIPSGSRNIKTSQAHQIGTHNHTYLAHTQLTTAESANERTYLQRYSEATNTSDNSAPENNGENRPRNIALAAIIKY